ncbi:class I SAM-dependent methyltransferase [Synechococcus sp. KORDI-49]|uniref:class I SAM-dependent methyltransferase n=1 Tax=Synechococcus sp. KORDI-49 TaxID=585423 RepID=UPI0008FF87DF|nr:class I SAM-dependent methyltransferase [Synechococcus sp. KORDI-49]
MPIKSQQKQHLQYSFPYHYIPSLDSSFRYAKFYPFAPSYHAACTLILNYFTSFFGESSFLKYADVGCGDGALLNFLLSQDTPFDVDPYGFDYDSNALRWASLFSPGTFFSNQDFISCAPYDVITCIEVLEHIPPDQILSFLSKLSNSLSKDGLLILTVPSINKPLENKHFQHFSESSLVSLLEPYFNIVSIMGFERYPFGYSVIKKIFNNKLFRLDIPVFNSFLYDSCLRLYPASCDKCGRLIACLSLL